MKWPADRKTLLSAYPGTDKYEVYVMGGAKVPEAILGRLPTNWTVLPFDSLPPKDYLAGLDVFVYFTHPDWVESFGRVIIEAMAAGVPVIVPPIYLPLFGDAALYTEPEGVLEHVDRLIEDPAYYEGRVGHALAYVDKKFSYGMHIERVRNLIEDAPGGAG